MNKDYLYLSAYYILKFLVYTMPHFILNFLAFCVSKIVFQLDKKHRKIIDINLKLCFPYKDENERKELAFKIYN
ncbi:lauroyl acyltransferase, partial [Campylobacter coli]|nr:lauroyl acyltransferase [Campylobacter coli]